jgi:hypothetical protein
MAANKTFLGSVHRNCPEQVELIGAAAGILPGNLLLRTANEFELHGGANLGGFVYVAKEQTASFDIDRAYEDGETVQAYVPHSGEFYQMLVATGQALVVDTPLTSNAAGLLDIATPATDVVICYSDEAVTTTATTKVRVKFK